MTYPKGSRGECMRHSRIRCGECEYVAELEEANKHYRQALEFYADKENYYLQKHDDIYEHYFTEVSEDAGETARQALEDAK